VTTQPPEPPPTPKLPPRLVRELVGVALLVVGAVTLLVCAWHLSPWLAAAVLGAATAAGGVALATNGEVDIQAAASVDVNRG
jgi:hypothetical protein